MLALNFGDRVKHRLMLTAGNREGLEAAALGAAPDFDRTAYRSSLMPASLMMRASIAGIITDPTMRPIGVVAGKTG